MPARPRTCCALTTFDFLDPNHLGFRDQLTLDYRDHAHGSGSASQKVHFSSLDRLGAAVVEHAVHADYDLA